MDRVLNGSDGSPYRPDMPGSAGEESDPAVKDLISKCWAEEPDDRPSLSEIKTTLKAFNKGKYVHQFSFSEGYLHVGNRVVLNLISCRLKLHTAV